MIDFTKMQVETGEWKRRSYPKTATVDKTAMKLAEEAGEVNGAIVKMAEGRLTIQDVKDEMGDTAIALAALAGELEREGYEVDIEAVIMNRWNEVRTR